MIQDYMEAGTSREEAEKRVTPLPIQWPYDTIPVTKDHSFLESR